MASASTFLGARDESFTSRNERDFLLSLCSNNITGKNEPLLRLDGRRAGELRPRKLEFHRRSATTASVTVVASGGTRVQCRVEGSLVPPPSPDRPQEGAVHASVELRPHAHPAWTMAAGAVSTMPNSGGGAGFPEDSPQQRLVHRILRTAEALLAGALEPEALCVTPHQWVWQLSCHLWVLDAASGGNVLDTAMLALFATLRHYRQPHVEVGSGGGNNNSSNGMPRIVPPQIKAPAPLPLHYTPLTVSFAIVTRAATTNKRDSDAMVDDLDDRDDDVVFLVDPTTLEEDVAAGSYLTIAGDAHGRVCQLQYQYRGNANSGGGGASNHATTILETPTPPAPGKLRTMVGRAMQDYIPKQWIPALEASLTKAQETAHAEELRLVQLQTTTQTLPGSSNDGEPEIPQVPFYVHSAEAAIPNDNTDSSGSKNNNPTNDSWTEADERYRQQALEYNRGHQAQKVRETNDANDRNGKANALTGQLAQRLLASVGATTSSSKAAAEHSKSESPAVKTNMDVEKEDASATPKDTNRMDIAYASDAKKSARTNDDDDDEEEEVTVQLQSEFASVKVAAPAAAAEEQPEADDLAAAIKKKKKKKKKK